MERPTAPMQPMRDTLTALGFVKVHTWYESHGDGGSETWQDKNLHDWSGSVSIVSLSFDRGGRLTGFRKEVGGFAHDYLMAKKIREDATGRWHEVKSRMEACGTGGATFYQDMHSWDPEFWAVVWAELVIDGPGPVRRPAPAAAPVKAKAAGKASKPAKRAAQKPAKQPAKKSAKRR